ncbi:MAG: rod shape-determining protein MreD [Chloroflexi bacterium]|nr:rod shape-determining protein MreD [Chloroflexota bacterium]
MLPELYFVPVRPNPMLLLVLACVVTIGMREALIWAFAGGLLVDYFSGMPLGTSSLGLLAVVAIAGLAQINVFRRGVMLPILFAFPGTILFELITMAALRTSGYQVDVFSSLLRLGFPAALLNMILMPLAYLLVLLLERLSPRAVETAG